MKRRALLLAAVLLGLAGCDDNTQATAIGEASSAPVTSRSYGEDDTTRAHDIVLAVPPRKGWMAGVVLQTSVTGMPGHALMTITFEATTGVHQAQTIDNETAVAYQSLVGRGDVIQIHHEHRLDLWSYEHDLVVLRRDAL